MSYDPNLIAENGKLQADKRELAELVRLRDIEIVRLNERIHELESERRLEPRVKTLEHLLWVS